MRILNVSVRNGDRIIRASLHTNRTAIRKTVLQIRDIKRSGTVAHTKTGTDNTKQIRIRGTGNCGPVTNKPGNGRGNSRTVHNYKTGRERPRQLADSGRIVSGATRRNVGDLESPQRDLTGERLGAVTVDRAVVSKNDKIVKVSVNLRSHGRCRGRERVSN
jgi:hypothetical protein